MFVQASSASPPQKAAAASVPEFVRRSGNYHPCPWGDHFLTYNTPDHAKPDGDTVQKIQLLKEEVKKMLLEAAHHPQQQLKLIDDIQRLGVAYHFQVEINAALRRMYDCYRDLCGNYENHGDLHIVALCFRLLRQHGLNVSPDVFNKFKDETKGTFKECLSKDAEGLLSLYEATHLRCNGEDILEEALAFTTFQLEGLKTQLKNPIAALVTRALKLPLWKSVNRVMARHYISVYGEYESHSKALLYLAKLDFNLLQKQYQSEIGKISSWWNTFNFQKTMPFARQRLVESYFWALETSFEPRYAVARSIQAKVLAVGILIDDMYDVYGTVEELTLFTDAIQRWDISALDQLPEYMRYIYQVILNFYREVEEELSEAGMPTSRAQFAKDSMKEAIRAHLFEAKCVNKCLVPTVEEYLPHSLIGSTVPLLTIHFMAGMGDAVTGENLEWLSTVPFVIRTAALYCRLLDDMVEHEAGKAEDTAYLVECYMKQHGVSKEYAFSEFEKQKEQAWKDINTECLCPTALPLAVATVVLNSPRLTYLLYEYQDIDGFTSSDTKTKELISSVLVDPIPI